MKRLLAILALLPFAGRAATYVASSPSWTDVSNALASCATSGDTVSIPAGASLWTNVLQVAKGASFIGAGTNSTHITNGVPIASPWGAGTVKPPLFWITHTNQNWLTRFSQLHIIGNKQVGASGWTNSGAWTNNLGFIYVDPANRNTNSWLSQFVVDRNWVQYIHSRAIYSDGDVFGVVYSNVFEDVFLIIEPTARHDVGWFRSWNSEPLLALGTTNTLVLENNTTHHTPVGAAWDGVGGAGGWGPTFGTAAGHGASYVYRFNLVTNSANTRLEGHDAHGNNQPPYVPGGWRGTRSVEIYGNNYYSPTGGRGPRWCHMRGGVSMIFSNTATVIGTANASFDDLQYGEEEWADSTTYIYPDDGVTVRTNNPAYDMVTNSYWWFNRRSEGTEFTKFANPAASSNYVVYGTDWWTNAPWETNIVTFVNRSGATNVMANYRPLAYPHPLRSGLDGTGSSPAASALNAANLNIGTVNYVGP